MPQPSADVYPILQYALGFLKERAGRDCEAAAYRQGGWTASPEYCFPNSLFELTVLESAIRANPEDDRAHYYIGNLLYDKKRTEEAVSHWETSARLRTGFPTVHRNLALAYFNTRNDADAALASLERALLPIREMPAYALNWISFTRN